MGFQQKGGLTHCCPINCEKHGLVTVVRDRMPHGRGIRVNSAFTDGIVCESRATVANLMSQIQ
jgi:hypothetical protein